VDSTLLAGIIGLGGAIIGGLGSALVSRFTTTKSIRAQDTFFRENINYDVTKQEENEKLIVKENALIVYYDLLLGLNDIKKLFLSKCIYDVEYIEPKRMYFSNDWVKNVAIISRDSRINREQINNIYIL